MARIINKIKNWLSWNAPRIITGRGLFIKLVEYDVERSKMEKEFNREKIGKVINELQELRKNTWDVERVDRTINWLKDNFEVKDEEC